MINEPSTPPQAPPEPSQEASAPSTPPPPAQPAEAARPDWTQSADALTEQIGKIIDKRVPGIIKDALKRNGVEDDDEIKSIIDTYRAGKSSEAKTSEEALNTLKVFPAYAGVNPSWSSTTR